MKSSLHFGLNKVDPEKYGGWNGTLQGCIPDATSLATLFVRAGYTAGLFTDEYCTIKNFSVHVQEIAALAKAGDQVVISYSGHGSNHISAASPDFTIETLCLYDGEFTDSQFRALRALFKPGVQVVIILDSCFSGGMDRALHAPRGRFMPATVKRSFTPVERPVLGVGVDPIVSDELLLCAAARGQTAGDGDRNGIFTGALLQTFQPRFTWGEWFQATANKVTTESFQNPCWFQCGNIAGSNV